jgi:DNA adenine methylase/adenine-specific DNA-methyltransferase
MRRVELRKGPASDLPERAAAYPELRYMGSKHRLLEWIHTVLAGLDFETAADPFLGSGCVAYLMKAMGRRVVGGDMLNFPVALAAATLTNDTVRLDGKSLERLLAPAPDAPDFIARTFAGIFFTAEDLRFLDRVSANVEGLGCPHRAALARAALIRSCLKKQPRGVFTVSGDLSRYDDGRRDLRLSLEEHFQEQVEAFNRVVFDNGHRHSARCADVFDHDPRGVDLVYLDPPYVPRADDNCYIKRYHFVEGLSCYWRGMTIMEDTKVRKIAKRLTPFGSRRTALAAFERLFDHFRASTIVLSYSSNGFPDLGELEALLGRGRRPVTVHARPHRYHFGTHKTAGRTKVMEYLLVAPR